VSISAVVQVLRVEKIEEPKSIDSQKAKLQNYLIAGFFNFMNEDDKGKLAVLLQ
jgi:hypothetical protein